VVELAVIGIGVQRDLSRNLKRPCKDAHDPLQQTIVRLCAPMVVSGVGYIMPFPTVFRGIALGCQIHDTALTTRGFCTKHRTARWVHDGVAYIVIGICMDAVIRTYAPEVLAGATVYLAAIGVCAVATCQPLKLVEPNPENNNGLQLPYMISYQLVERLRRAFVAGAFAPNLWKRTPMATTILRVYRVFQHPVTQCFLPMEIARPELHYLMAEIITPKSLSKALKAINGILKATNSRLCSNTTLYLPYVASLATGQPDPVISLIQQIIRDPSNVATVHTLKRHLAKRYSDARADSPPTFQEWNELGVTGTQVTQWNLNAVLSNSTWVDLDDQRREPWEDEMGSLCFVDVSEEDIPIREDDSMWIEVLSNSI
jgi:hypothetical protein